MSNSGKWLENIVSQIEGFLLPVGFKVETREHVFNDEGIQIAEFDIIISGQIGSSPFKMLIECRDRPSDGPVPGSWIEQLVGRRSRFRFNSVIAVSTTGFAPGAKKFADQAGIELRALTELNLETITNRISAILEDRRAIPVSIKIVPVDYDNPAVLNKLDQLLPIINKKTPILFEKITDQIPKFSAQDIWIRVVSENPHLFAGIEINDPAKCLNIIVTFGKDFEKFQLTPNSDPNCPIIGLNLNTPELGYHIKVGEETFRILSIEFKGEFSIKRIVAPISKAYQYSIFKENAVAVSIHFDYGDGDYDFIIRNEMP